MANHRAGERGQGFRRNLDRPRREKLIVNGHEQRFNEALAGSNDGRGGHSSRRDNSASTFLDEANISVRFDACDLDLFQRVGGRVQPHIFTNVFRVQMRAYHHCALI